MPDKENDLINALTIVSTIIAMIAIPLLIDDFFAKSFLSNLLCVPFWIISGFLCAGFLILLPTIVVCAIIQTKSSDFQELSTRGKIITVCIAIILIWIILTVAVTYWI